MPRTVSCYVYASIATTMLVPAQVLQAAGQPAAAAQDGYCSRRHRRSCNAGSDLVMQGRSPVGLREGCWRCRSARPRRRQEDGEGRLLGGAGLLV